MAAAALCAPATAAAQSAGDDQYQDPVAGEDQGQSGGGSGEPAPAAQAPATPAAPAAPEAGTPAAQGGGSGSELPYTGADAGLLMLAGTLLLASGTALRVRLRER